MRLSLLLQNTGILLAWNVPRVAKFLLENLVQARGDERLCHHLIFRRDPSARSLWSGTQQTTSILCWAAAAAFLDKEAGSSVNYQTLGHTFSPGWNITTAWPPAALALFLPPALPVNRCRLFSLLLLFAIVVGAHKSGRDVSKQGLWDPFLFSSWGVTFSARRLLLLEYMGRMWTQ